MKDYREEALKEAAANGITEEMIDAAEEAMDSVHDMDVPGYRYAIAMVEAVAPLIRQKAIDEFFDDLVTKVAAEIEQRQAGSKQ